MRPDPGADVALATTLERVLHGVLGIVLLAGQAPRERQQLRQLTLDPRLQLALAVSAVVGGCPVSVSHPVLRAGKCHKTEVAQMSFVSFMRSAAGRGLRIVAGGALIVTGIAIGGTGGTILAIVGRRAHGSRGVQRLPIRTAGQPGLHGPQARCELSQAVRDGMS
jgi:hypothetical protein